MIRKKPAQFLLALSLCGLATIALLGGLAVTGGLALLPRPQPKPSSQELFEGVTYKREVRRSPRPMVIHVVTINLRSEGIRLLVTPGDPKADRSLKARTTTKFLNDFNVQIAINGSGFTPWYSYHLLHYYPHSGDPVDPVGFAASQGTIYSEDTQDQPVLYLSRTNQARFGSPLGKVYNAISGNAMLVQNGQVLPDLDGEAQPRSAIGLDKSGRRLILVVVDGRQPRYSQGATLEELAAILIDHGAHSAMNLDGGGSTSLAIQEGSHAALLNSPINHGIPGWERPVGNHLGIFASP
jgi:hypothetical protein